MPDNVRIVRSHVDDVEMHGNRDNFHAAIHRLTERREASHMTEPLRILANPDPRDTTQGWTTEDDIIIYERVEGTSTPQITLESEGGLMLRLDHLDLDKPIRDLVQGDLTDIMIQALTLAIEVMDIPIDDPKIAKGEQAVDVAYGWALSILEDRISKGGDPNQDIEVSLRSPWAGAECTFFPDYDDEDHGCMIPHEPQEEPNITALNICFTSAGAVIRPVTKMVTHRPDALTALRAVTTYRNSLA